MLHRSINSCLFYKRSVAPQSVAVNVLFTFSNLNNLMRFCEDLNNQKLAAKN